MPVSKRPSSASGLRHAQQGDVPADVPATRIEGMDESNWLDVIQKMDEVYSQLVADEVALEAKNAELEQQQQFIYSLLSAMSDVLVACNEHGVIEQTNAALCKLVGRSEEQLRGTAFAALLADPAGVARLQAVTQAAPSRSSLGAVTIEVDLRDAQGAAVPVDFNCTPRLSPRGQRLGHVFVGRPLGELKRAYHELRETHEELKRTQEQLLHSEKLASLGRLVAGVAHELNNPISFVLGNVHVLARYTGRLQQYVGALHDGAAAADLAQLRRQLRIDHALGDLGSLMEGTLEGATRTADIVAGLKRFSAMDREEQEVLDLQAVVERAIHWVRKGTAPSFDVQWQPGPPTWVRGNAGQLLQVLMNLVQNAYDAAAPHSARPALCITQSIVGRTLRLDLQDNGPGIAAEHLGRVFDPFFTTKPVGKGTGLGLSISYGIVERHSGRISVANAAQGGAVFTLELPLCEPPPAEG